MPVHHAPIGKFAVSAMTPVHSAHDLGIALRAVRKRLGLSQSDLALAAGVGVRFIVDLEGGKATVRLEQILRVIDALGGSLALIGLETAPSLQGKADHEP
jgi:HTH-type transcriptional regulator/antitoxin HipB